ncbi:MAG: hypothetical protein LBV72_12985 [Tannerella sp.]|jgi:hypothetical protein|nr:hypothetical protein [Tannerella sp.]
MKKYIVVVSVIVALMTACNSTRQDGNQREDSTLTTNTDATKKEIPFQTAERYFVKNTVENKNLTLKITNQEDFDNYFEAAATMGESGKPTVIDFSKQFVIAIIAESSSIEKNIIVSDLTSKENELSVSYKIDEKGEERSYVSRSLSLMIVDNKYSGEVKFEKQ